MQYLDVPVRNLRDLSSVNAAAVAEPRQWRAYVECAETAQKSRSARKEVKDLVTGCRAAGLSGWILYDARNQYNLTPEFIRDLIPDDR